MLMLRTDPIPIQLDVDGTARVGGTRVTLQSVVWAFKAGATPEEIAQKYPTLMLADIYAVITYYLRSTDEVEIYLQSQAEKAAQVRQANEARFDPNGIRERLLARQSEQDTIG